MATLNSRKRSHAMSQTPSDEELEFPNVGHSRQDHRQIKLETSSAVAASDGVEERWAVQLLLLLRSSPSPSTTPSEDDSENVSDNEEAGGQDGNGWRPAHDAERPDFSAGQTPTTAGLRRSGRTRRVVGMEDYVWGEGDEAYLYESARMDEEEQDGSDDSGNKDDREEEDRKEEDGRQENEQNSDGEAEEEEDDEEEPEEEDFSEGDEYVEPPSSSSSRQTRSLRNRARRPSSPPSPATAHSTTAHYRSVCANSAAGTASQLAAVKFVSDEQQQPTEFMVKGLPSSAYHASSSPGQPASTSTSSPVSTLDHHQHRSLSPPLAPAPGPGPHNNNGAKKTRKPKYSAALEARWEEKFEWLMTYRRAKGNCRVAEGNKEYPGLGKWLSNQKTLCKKGKLKADRRQRLIDVGAITDPASTSSPSLSSSALSGNLGGPHMSSPPSSPLSASSTSASPYLTSSAFQPQQIQNQQQQKRQGLMESPRPMDEEDEEAQGGPISKRRRRQLTVDVDRLPSMGSSDQEADSAASSPSGPLAAPLGLFSASSPFRTFQGKPILPSLTFPPHPGVGGGLHAHLPPQQPQLQNGGASSGSSFLSFALTSMPALFTPYPILGNPTAAGNLTSPHPHTLPL